MSPTKPKAKPKAKRQPAKKTTKAKPPALKKSGKGKAGRPKRFQPPKADLPDLNDPLRQVADWIVAGVADSQIDEAIMTIGKVSRAEAIEIRQGAYAYLEALIAAEPETRKTWHVATRLELYRRTLQIHDYKTARDILRDLAQLEGLYPKTTAKGSSSTGLEAGDGLEGIPTAEDAIGPN